VNLYPVEVVNEDRIVLSPVLSELGKSLSGTAVYHSPGHPHPDPSAFVSDRRTIFTVPLNCVIVHPDMDHTAWTTFGGGTSARICIANTTSHARAISRAGGNLIIQNAYMLFGTTDLNSSVANAYCGTLGSFPSSPDDSIEEINRLNSQLVATLVALTGQSVVSQPQQPRLVADILAERSVAEVDENSAAAADVATRDAEVVVRRANLGGNPQIMFSEDGILSLQWQRDQYGVALVFAGDGLASIAFRHPDQLYAENGIEISVDDDLPQSFHEALAVVLA
jgi:hypothetical protein